MSIASAITAAQGRVANAYTAVDTKGGTLPETQDLSNLPDAILSIPAGSGGDSVVVLASDSTRTYQEGDKVLLTPTSEVYDKTLFSSTTTNSSNITLPLTNDHAFGILDYRNGVCSTAYGLGSSANAYQLHAYWNSSLSSLGNPVKTTINSTYPFVNVNYDGDFPWASRGQDLYTAKGVKYNTLGYLGDTGSFVAGPVYSSDDWGEGLIQCVGPFAKIDALVFVWYVYYINSTGGISRLYSPDRNCFPSKYKGDWYIVNSSGVHPFSNFSATTYGVSGFNKYEGTNYARSKFLDGNGDYFWEYNVNVSPSQWILRKVNKNDTTWTFTNLTAAAAAYKDCLINYTESSGPDGWVMHSRDLGDTVESFMCGKTFGYDPNTGKGNKIAHFIFDKATNTVKRLPDVFLEVSDTYTFCNGFQVNWELGLIAVSVGYATSSSNQTFTLFVKKFNNLAQMYEYQALTTDGKNYTPDSLTGFVESNLGTDVMGNTMLQVSTIRPPDAPPFSNIDIVFGMDIVVNEGVI